MAEVYKNGPVEVSFTVYEVSESSYFSFGLLCSIFWITFLWCVYILFASLLSKYTCFIDVVYVLITKDLEV